MTDVALALRALHLPSRLVSFVQRQGADALLEPPSIFLHPYGGGLM